MASNLLGVCLLFFFVMLVEATADGICNRTELTSDTKVVRKWRYVYGRRKTYMDYEPIKRIVLECCEGYKGDEIRSTAGPPGTAPICIPQCEPPCTHGTCVKPNICNCVPGYEFKNGTCQPVCSEPCNNGTCVEPETCKCFTGYRMTDVNVCTPVCSMGCGNGSCISPEVCHCNDGFTLTNGTCEPKCWPPCETGECIGPDTCGCGPGYERIMSNVTVCEPICSPACVNGVCVGPNICMCDKGYEWQNGTCRPICSRTCVHASCEAPETCECFEGYKEDPKNVCSPKCKNGCGFGVCISPEVCHCNDGFSFINGTCQPVCTTPCATPSRSSVSWMYYVIPVLVLLIIILIIILIWKRHSIADFFVGRSYVISEDQKHTANKNNIPDVTYSAMQERQAKREGRNIKTTK